MKVLAINNETSNPCTTYNRHHRVGGKVHQPSDVIVLVDLVGTLSQSQKYLRIQSNVPVVLFGVIGLISALNIG